MPASMIFLIEYNRSEVCLVPFRNFDNVRMREAENARFEIELDLNRKGTEPEGILFDYGV